MLNSQPSNDEFDEIDEQPKDRIVVLLAVVVILVALIIPVGMIFTNRGIAVSALLLLFFRLLLIALPVYLAYRTVKLLLQKRWKEAGILAIVTLVVLIVCAVVFGLLIPVTIQ